MAEPQDKPKILVDEDWKSKVQTEKETAKPSGHGTPEAAAAKAEPPPARAELDDLRAELPRASFTSLVTMLATQAMVALGQIPDPMQNKPVVRLNFARHYIDTLGVLEEKTKGGQLTADEAALLEHVLFDLRLAFVEAQKRSGASVK